MPRGCLWGAPRDYCGQTGRQGEGVACRGGPVLKATRDVSGLKTTMYCPGIALGARSLITAGNWGEAGRAPATLVSASTPASRTKQAQKEKYLIGHLSRIVSSSLTQPGSRNSCVGANSLERNRSRVGWPWFTLCSEESCRIVTTGGEVLEELLK